MPTGGFLRTNFRRTGGSTMLAIGGGVFAGSWGGAVGPNYAQNFGFICGSFADSAQSVISSPSAFSAAVMLDPYVAMTSYYGTIYTSGYRIYPFWINLISIAGGSVSIGIQNGFVPVVSMTNSAGWSSPLIYAMGPTGWTLNPSTWTGHFVWAGFVISTP